MLADLFACVNSPNGWTTAGEDVQFKVANRTLYLQPSKSRADWQHNFDAWGEVYGASDVPFIGHRGFNRAWLSVKSIIETLGFDRIVGYSYGAALAERAHENFFHRKGYQPLTWCFGGPASIWQPSRVLRSRMTNVINIHNPNDIVYLSTLALGYRHVGVTRTLPWARATGAPWYLAISGHTAEQYTYALKGL
jgi:hypothetical protein